MDSRLLKQLLWQIRLRPAEWGVGTALVLLAGAVLWQMFGITPLEHEVEAVRARVESLERRKSEQKVARDSDPKYQLERFYEHFSGGGTVPERLNTLYSLAEREGITLARGEYRLSSQRNSRLESYQVTLPVQGQYAKLRRFLHHVLADVQTASLDQIRFERKKVGDASIEAQLVLTLYVTAPAPDSELKPASARPGAAPWNAAPAERQLRNPDSDGELERFQQRVTRAGALAPADVLPWLSPEATASRPASDNCEVLKACPAPVYEGPRLLADLPAPATPGAPLALLRETPAMESWSLPAQAVDVPFRNLSGTGPVMRY